MSKKKIMIMRGYFFPETAASNQMCLEVAKSFAIHGYDTEIFCPIPTRGVDKKTRSEYKKKKHEQISENLVVRRYWLPNEKHSIILRALRYFLQNICQIIHGLLSSYDVLFLYSTPPTNGLVGSILKRLKKIQFIYNLHDVFPDSLVSSGITSENSLLFKIGKKIEKVTYRNADRIIVISNEIKRNVLSKGISADKVTLVYNWVDESRIHRIKREENGLAKELKISSTDFVVTYAGNIGEAQSVSTLVDAAKLLSQGNIRIVIIGNGACEFECKKKAEGIPNICFMPMQPISRLSEVYSLGDASIVSCKKGFGGCGMPSKFGSITAAGTALIASFDTNSELSDIVRNNELGVCVPPENSQSLADAIVDLYNKRQKCNEYGRNGRAFLLRHMTKDICTNAILKVVEE